MKYQILLLIILKSHYCLEVMPSLLEMMRTCDISTAVGNTFWTYVDKDEATFNTL